MASFHGQLPLYTVDSFSTKPFGGNPAAVCLDHTEEGLSSAQMLQIANELNLSETSFIRRLSDADNFQTTSKFGLRWFTPTVEIKLCGHATLAAAAVLFKCVHNRSDAIKFETLSGTLTTKNTPTGITMDFPLDDPKPLDDKDKAVFAELLKLVAPVDSIQDVMYGHYNQILLVRLKDDSLTRNGFEELPVQVDKFQTAYTAGKLVGLCVTIRATPDGDFHDDDGTCYDFVSRLFAPWSGIPEDPVTGAAYTVLGAYWSKILNKSTFYAHQCSKRGGDLHLAVREADDRVDISGAATVIIKGHITI